MGTHTWLFLILERHTDLSRCQLYDTSLSHGLWPKKLYGSVSVPQAPAWSLAYEHLSQVSEKEGDKKVKQEALHKSPPLTL